MANPTVINLNDTNPSANTGYADVKWQKGNVYTTTITINGQTISVQAANVSAETLNFGGVDPRTTVTETVALASQGKLITFNTVNSAAVTLNSAGVITNFSCAVKNIGTGAATLTPSSGAINGESSWPLAAMDGGWLWFDGTNWWLVEAESAQNGMAVLFCDQTSSDISGYKELITTSPISGETTYAASGNAGAGEVLIKAFATNSGAPSVNLFPMGMWIPSFYASVDSISQGPQMVIRVYKRDTTGTETQLWVLNVALTATATTFYDLSTEQPNITMAASDRLVVKFFLLAGGASSRTLTLYVDGTTHPSHIHLPVGAINIARTELVNKQAGTTYPIVDADRSYLVAFTNAAAVTVTLPQAGVAGFVAGWFCDVVAEGAGGTTITPATSTIDGQSSLALTQYQGCRIVSDGTNYFTVRGLGTGGGGGTGTVTNVGALTAHAVILGVDGTTNVKAITSTGTAGQALLSNGASADPSFQPVVLNVGALTNHAVIIGQGNINVAAIGTGTAGQVLTSQGPSADPAFAATTLVRTTATISAGSIAGGASATGSATVAKGSILYQVVVGFICRIRLYSTAAGRDSDAGRSVSVQAPWNVGLLVELYLDLAGLLTFLMQPPAIMVNMDGTPASTIYWSMTNIDTVSHSYTVTLTVLPMET
jgi:hypothetical protein